MSFIFHEIGWEVRWYMSKTLSVTCYCSMQLQNPQIGLNFRYGWIQVLKWCILESLWSLALSSLFVYVGFILIEVKWSEVAQLCPTLCDPIHYSLQGSSVHGIFQARVLEWVAISFSKGSSRTQVSRIAGRRFTVWATREAPRAVEDTEKSLSENEANIDKKWTES